MKKIFFILFVSLLVLSSCKKSDETKDTFVIDNYTKQEVDIEMRDGIKLHTTIYSPKDTSKEYPILMQRTPYSSRPYGEEMRTKIGPNVHLMKEGNIIVYQDGQGNFQEDTVFELPDGLWGKNTITNAVPNRQTKNKCGVRRLFNKIEQPINKEAGGRVTIWGTSAVSGGRQPSPATTRVP